MNSLVSNFRKASAIFLAAASMVAVAAQPSFADRISNPVAEFNGLDKITGRITSFDVYIGETVQFGALQVTPRVCYSRDDKEVQRIDSFVEVEEITLDRKIRRIFTGWMFADSPGLNAVEHPIYDVWLKGCKLKSDVPPPEGLALPDSTPQPDIQQLTREAEETPDPAATAAQQQADEAFGTDANQQDGVNPDSAQTLDDLLQSDDPFQTQDGAPADGEFQAQDGFPNADGQLPEDGLDFGNPQQPDEEFRDSQQLKGAQPGSGLF